MTDNVVYGIDFRAGKERAPECNAPDVQAPLYWPWEQPASRNHDADTSPSEMDSGDCA